MKIFITGATGFLGQYLVRELSPNFETIYVLTRNAQFGGFADLANVQLVSGDITHLEVFESDIAHDKVLAECDFVVHAAALYQLGAKHAECYLQNVVGTQNILELVKKIKNLKAFYYISTIAVGDDQLLLLKEDELPYRRKFNDFYSETKYLAEKMLRESENNFPVRIIRPGIIVGDSKTGKMDKIDGPYYFIEAMKKYSIFLKTLPFMPLSFNPQSEIPLIPVDHCARFISLLVSRDDRSVNLKTYHLVSNEVPSVSQFLKDTNQAFGLSNYYIPVKKNPIHNRLLKQLGIPPEVIPFMFSKLSYDKTRTVVDLPEIVESRYTDYKSKIFGKI
jgi:thioester reductase-like protein